MDLVHGLPSLAAVIATLRIVASRAGAVAAADDAIARSAGWQRYSLA
jgi:hypothetical protein